MAYRVIYYDNDEVQYGPELTIEQAIDTARYGNSHRPVWLRDTITGREFQASELLFLRSTFESETSPFRVTSGHQIPQITEKVTLDQRFDLPDESLWHPPVANAVTQLSIVSSRPLKDKPTMVALSVEQVDALIDAAAQNARTKPLQALALIEGARAAAEALGEPDRIARVLLAESEARYFGGQTDSLNRAEKAADQARHIAVEIRDRSIEFSALACLIRAISRKNDLAGALACARRQIELGYEEQRETSDVFLLSRALGNMGSLYLDAHDYPGAVPYLTEALHLARQAQNTPHRSPSAIRSQNLDKLEAIILSNMANIHQGSGRYTEAIAVYQEVAQRHTARNDFPPLIKVQGNLIDCYLHLNRLAEAETICREAFTLIETSGIRQSESTLRLRQGRLLRLQGHLEEAEETLAIGIAQIDITGDSVFLPSLMAERGLVAKMRGEATTAVKMLQEALSLSIAMNSTTDSRDICGYLTEVTEAQGDLASALHYSKEYHRLSQSIQAEIAERRMAIGLASLASDTAPRTVQESPQPVHVEAPKSKTRKTEETGDRDPLTGAHNRAFLDSWLRDRLERVQRFGASLSIALLDLDDFKQINERLSSQMGDQILCAVSDLLQEEIRAEDLFARYGGEEFLIALPGLSRIEASAVGERLREKLMAHHWQQYDANLSVTVSIGIADSTDAHTVEGLISIAEARLYRAKVSGKNQVDSEEKFPRIDASGM